MIIPQLISE